MTGFLTSCNSELLNLSPLTQLSEGNFYNSTSELKQAADDVYRQLGRLANASSVMDLYGELYSDNTEFVFQTAGDAVDEAISNYAIRASNSRILTAWNNTYNSIFICNNVIQQVENTDLDLDDALRKRWIGEALVVRSFAYFNLVRVFGGVPLILERIAPQSAYDYLRETPETIYAQLAQDLQTAKNFLPKKYTGNDVGRVTSYSASALLAKVYLTIGDKNRAREELEYIINSNEYSLDANSDGKIDAADYSHLFQSQTKNCKESILEAQYMAGVNAFNSNHQTSYMPFHHAFNLPGVPGTFRGSGLNTPSRNLMNEYEPNDPRKDISIAMGYTDQNTGSFVEYPYTRKFYDPNWANPGQNFEIIRYADILLMYAEVTDDPTHLNRVRARVNLPAFGSAEYPSDKYPTLALAIEHERRVELAHEMHRMFDLVRTGRAIAVISSKGYPINEDKLLFPIPENAIDVNPGLTQNRGY